MPGLNRQNSQRDLAAMDTSFTSFNKYAKHLAKSIEQGHADASQASTSLLAVKEEVQSSVRDWAKEVTENSTRMVDGLLEHQQDHLKMVTASLD